MTMIKKEWMKQYGYLMEYYNQNRSWPGGETVFPQNNPLGRWCDQLRDEFHQNELSTIQRTKLLNLGFSFMTADDKWKMQLDYLKQFVIKYRRLPDFNDQFPEGNFLGRWFQIQQISKRRDSLSDDQLSLLNTVISEALSL